MCTNVALNLCIYLAVLACALDSSIQTTVEVGDTKRFQCTLEEPYPPGDINWLIEWDNGETFTVNAMVPGTLSGDILGGRGNYRTLYNSRGFITSILHQCALEISEVSIHDQGYFKCVHAGWAQNRGTFFSAYLTVVESQEGSLQCSFSPVGDQDLQLTTGSLVTLQCELEGETLSWYDGNGYIIQNALALIGRNRIEYTLQDTDNGADLVCKTDSSGEDQRECRVAPFAQLPNVAITPMSQEVMVDVDNTAKLTCCGEGKPSINRYEWYLNGYPVATGNRFYISSSGTCENLHMLHLTQKDNITQILCEVSTVNGLSASAVATVIVVENQKTKGNSTSQTTATDDSVITTKTVGVADHSVAARAHLSETAFLNCTAYGSPPPNISWIRKQDNTQLTDGDEGGRITVHVVETGSFFKTSILGIGNLVNDDNGQYVCTTLNDQNDQIGDNETLSVYVLGKFCLFVCFVFISMKCMSELLWILVYNLYDFELAVLSLHILLDANQPAFAHNCAQTSPQNVWKTHARKRCTDSCEVIFDVN